MKEIIKSLGNAFAIKTFLQIFLVFAMLFTLGGIMVFIPVGILYHFDVRPWVLAIVGWGAWAGFLILMVIVYYIKRADFNNKLHLVLSLVSQINGVGLGLLALKKALTKKKKDKKPG